MMCVDDRLVILNADRHHQTRALSSPEKLLVESKGKRKRRFPSKREGSLDSKEPGDSDRLNLNFMRFGAVEVMPV